jgi:hypothetical protein
MNSKLSCIKHFLHNQKRIQDLGKAGRRALHIKIHGQFQRCDRLWETPAKVGRQNSEKKGKSKKTTKKQKYSEAACRRHGHQTAPFW